MTGVGPEALSGGQDTQDALGGKRRGAQGIQIKGGRPAATGVF